MLFSAATLGLFTAVQATALARGLDIGCGCFGAAEQQSIDGSSLALVAGLLFCSLSGYFCWVSTPSPALDRSEADAQRAV
jgi:hypothetical protein